MASAMPVLPLVASISVSPGLTSPRRSAPSTIESAGRSFTEPAGLLPSSFARRVLEVLPGMRCRRTSGVLPTKCSRVRVMASRRAARGLHHLEAHVVDAGAPRALERGADLDHLGARKHLDVHRH